MMTFLSRAFAEPEVYDVALDRKQHKGRADFDSTIRRFDPSRPSQKFSGQNNALARKLRPVSIDSMSRRVAKISVCFQGLPNIAGSSTRHGRNMEWEKSSLYDAR
jgi:hypothetical protein